MKDEPLEIRLDNFPPDSFGDVVEKHARELRARVYGECKDESWEAVKGNWMTDENLHSRRTCHS